MNILKWLNRKNLDINMKAGLDFINATIWAQVGWGAIWFM